MSDKIKEIKHYLESSKTAVLATIDSNRYPNIRTIGGFGVKEITIYFSTVKGSSKVGQIKENNNVSLLFQHEGQAIPNFINIELKGLAEVIKDKVEFEEGVKYISKRRPQLKITEETHNIYRVVPKEIKILNLSKEKTEERIRKIEF